MFQHGVGERLLSICHPASFRRERRYIERRADEISEAVGDQRGTRLSLLSGFGIDPQFTIDVENERSRFQQRNDPRQEQLDRRRQVALFDAQ